MRLKLIETQVGDQMQYRVVNSATGEPVEGIAACKVNTGTDGERMLTLATRLFSVSTEEPPKSEIEGAAG